MYLLVRKRLEDLIEKNYKNEPFKPAKLHPIKIELRSNVQENELLQKPYRPHDKERYILSQKIPQMVHIAFLTKKEGIARMPCFLVKKKNGWK